MDSNDNHDDEFQGYLNLEDSYRLVALGKHN